MLVQSIAGVKRRVVFHAVAKWRARMNRTGSRYPRLRIRQPCIRAIRFATGFELPSDEAIMHGDRDRAGVSANATVELRPKLCFSGRAN
jgi:hypothetical protein